MTESLVSKAAVPLLAPLVLAMLACSGTGPELPQRSADGGVTAVGAAPNGSVDQVQLVGGVADRNRDPAVVALDLGNHGLCTGSLIAPRVVLTARHCVSETNPVVNCAERTPQIGADRDPSSIGIFAGDDIKTASVIARGQELVTAHATSLCGEDIALVLLDRNVTSVAPLALSKRHVVVGDYVRAVGFGKGSDKGGAGMKLLREHVRVVGKSAAEFEVGEATCNGDSGGPAIEEATGAVFGVVSRGGPSCEGSNVKNVYSRVDAHAALISAALTRANELSAGDKKAGAPAATGKQPSATGKPESDMGNPCTQGADCATGICFKDGAAAYCSRSCGSADRCPAHYRCKKVAGAQVCAQHG